MFMRTLRIKVILISLFLLLFSALNLRAQAQQEDKITVMEWCLTNSWAFP